MPVLGLGAARVLVSAPSPKRHPVRAQTRQEVRDREGAIASARGACAPQRTNAPEKLTTTLLFRCANCFDAMLDRNAARCVKREARHFHRASMKPLISSLSLIVALLWAAVLPANAQVNV